MRLVDRLDIDTNRGVVRLMIGDLPDPFVLVMSPAYARTLITDLQEAIGVAELDNEERDAEHHADALESASPDGSAGDGG